MINFFDDDNDNGDHDDDGDCKIKIAGCRWERLAANLLAWTTSPKVGLMDYIASLMVMMMMTMMGMMMMVVMVGIAGEPEEEDADDDNDLGKLPKKKRFVLGYLSQMWVGRVADSLTRSKPLKTPPNCPENRLF